MVEEEKFPSKLINVYLVESSNRFYDEGGEWTVGYFMSTEEAKKAMKEQEEIYKDDEYFEMWLSVLEIDTFNNKIEWKELP